MIVVTLTSWTKRIGNVKKVVESIMESTVKPDRVYLNLSREEFMGVPLPKDLIEYFYSDDRLIINWVDGPNTKTFKKLFPILQYLEDDDIIMEMDDDFLAPPDLIECRLKDFESLGMRHPITSNLSRASIGDTFVVAPTPMFSKKMVANWERFVDDTVINTYNDDRTLLYIFWLNGYRTRPCSRYTAKGMKKFRQLNPVSPLKGQYPVGREYDTVVAPVVERLTGTTIQDSFGFFKRETTKGGGDIHDVVIPWCHRGIASEVMRCGDRLEIEYVVESLIKYCGSWLGRIFIVGSEPPESITDKVVHIPCDDPYTHSKDANIIHKILYACENIPDLSDDFVKASDDQIVTCETKFEDLTPRIVRMYSEWNEEMWDRNRCMDRWHDNLWLTLHLFDLEKAAFWEPHMWCPLNKHRYMEMCAKYNWRKSRACIDNTLYYNYIGQEPVPQFDHLHLQRNRAKEMIDNLDTDNLPRHLSWTDAAFIDKRFRDLLDKIIFGND